MIIPWNKENYIPGAGVYAFSQEAAEAWAWAFDRDGDAQMKPSISRELGQDLVKHQSVIENHRKHAKSLEFAVGCGAKAWCASLSGMYSDPCLQAKPPSVQLMGFVYMQHRQHWSETAKSV